MKVSKPLFHSNNDVSHLRKIKKKEIKKNFIISRTTEDCNIKLESRKIQLQWSSIIVYSSTVTDIEAERRKGKVIAKRTMRVTEEKTTGREYHLSSGCLPVKQAANAIQFAWWKASLLSFLPSSSNEPRSASFVSAFLRSPNFLPPFLLTAALLSSPFRPFTIPYHALYTFLLHFPPFISSQTVSSFS